MVDLALQPLADILSKSMSTAADFEQKLSAYLRAAMILSIAAPSHAQRGSIIDDTRRLPPRTPNPFNCACQQPTCSNNQSANQI
ncbi:MAG TPA: hypothetical protein VHS31_06935 [Tepidisphaeraceae bacterium]|jgi:hypothetical protein|nr:hypothetical protein [Tepidisphaeraceae bacterium]